MAQRNGTKSFLKKNWWIIPLALIFFVVICLGTVRYIHNLADTSDLDTPNTPLIEEMPQTEEEKHIETPEYSAPEYSLSIIDSIPDGGWQAERSFPD